MKKCEICGAVEACETLLVQTIGPCVGTGTRDLDLCPDCAYFKKKGVVPEWRLYRAIEKMEKTLTREAPCSAGIWSDWQTFKETALGLPSGCPIGMPGVEGARGTDCPGPGPQGPA